MATGPKKLRKKPPAPVCLRHTAVLVLLDTLRGKPPAQQVVSVPAQERQMLQHIRMGGAAPEKAAAAPYFEAPAAEERDRS